MPNLFVAGGQLAGRRTGTIFIENGRFHGEQVAKTLASRLRARNSPRRSRRAMTAYVGGNPGGVSDGSLPTTTAQGRTVQFVTSPPVT